MDAISRTQIYINVAYVGHIVARFCFLFVVYTMNPPHRNVSALVLVGFVLAAVYAIAVGFAMRKKFFTQSTEALPNDPRKALGLWRTANSIGLSSAMSLTIFGAALKFLGSSWLALGIFFVVSLGFLVVWRPRPLAANGARPA